jgi:hypothetical protein
MVDSVHDTFEFFFEPIIGANIQLAFQQCVKGVVEILFSSIRVPCLVVCQSCLIFLFDAREQIVDLIRRGLQGRGLKFDLRRLGWLLALSVCRWWRGASLRLCGGARFGG